MFKKKKNDEDRFEKEDDGDSSDDIFEGGVFGRDPFGGLFGDFGRIDKMMNELMKNAFSGKMKFEGGQPFVYGFSLKSGPDGKPVFEEFGNVKPGVKPQVSDTREPLVDVMDRGETIIVIAELPGVEKADIYLEATGSVLEIKVDKPGKKFYKQVQLPVDVQDDAVDATYNNGVLEVKLKKKQASKPKGKKIEVK